MSKEAKLSGSDIMVETGSNEKNPVKIFFSKVCPGVRVEAELENGKKISGFVSAFSSIKGKTGHSSLILDNGKYVLNWRLGGFETAGFKTQKISYEDGRRVNPTPPIISLGKIDGGAVKEYEEDTEALALYRDSSGIKTIKLI
jgi:hypothetical protein